MAGYQDCTCPFEVWGVHSNAVVKESKDNGGSNFPAIEPYPYDDNPGTFIAHWINDGDPGPVFITYGVKVPSSYPYQSCDKFPPHSSADERIPEIEQWSVPICTTFEEKTIEEGEISERKGRDQNTHYAFASRAVYVDSVQKYIVYKISSQKDWPSDHHINGASDSDNDSQLGTVDLVQIDIGTKIPTTFYIGTLSPLNGSFDFTVMEGMFYSQTIVDVGLPSEQNYAVPPWNGAHCGESPVPYFELGVQGYSIGKEYLNTAGYMPGVESWAITRVHLTDDFSANRDRVYTTLEDAITTPSDGTFAPMLPSARVYILTEPPEPSTGDFSDPESRQPDECWWIAKDTTSVVTGRLLNKDLVAGGDIMTGTWTGYMRSDEVANILHTFDEEEEIHCRCYQHIDGKDYAIITIGDTETQTDMLIATFGDLLSAADLNEGLPDDNGFDNPLEDTGDQVTAQNNAYYVGGDPENGNDSTKWAAEFAVGPAFAWHAQLVRKVVVKNAGGTLQFDMRLFNPAASIDAPTIPRGNFPATDGAGNYDTLSLFVNGVLRWQTDNTNEGADISTFYNFRTISVGDIPAGDVIFRWILTRATSLNYLKAWIDNVHFPEEVLTQELTNEKIFFYDGAELRDFPKVEWPARSSEGINLTAGSGTPDYIMPDNQGRILLGNPHFLMRFSTSGTLDTSFAHNGTLRFTASPAKNPLSEIKDPELKAELKKLIDNGVVDTVKDPPWGGFQIMALKNGNIQVRGTNGSYTDATSNGVSRQNFPGEQFVYDLQPGDWPSRAHAWTIKNDGIVRVPHLEILWRTDFALPAYPVGPPLTGDPPIEADYSVPPNWFGFGYDGPNWLAASPSGGVIGIGLNTTSPGGMRWRRSSLQGTQEETLIEKPRWFFSNLIFSRQYCTTFSRRDQYVWWTSQLRDPTEDDSPEIQAILPYPSAKWYTYQKWHDPITSSYCHFIPIKVLYDIDDSSKFYYSNRINREHNGRLTDFDAVDCGCDCGCMDSYTPLDGDPGADGTITKIYEFDEDLEGFSPGGITDNLDVEWDTDKLTIANVSNFSQVFNKVSLSNDLTFDFPSTASRIKKIQVVSIAARIEQYENIINQELQILLTSDTGLPLTNEDGSVMLSTPLPGEVGEWNTIEGFSEKRILEQYQDLDTDWKVKIRLVVYPILPAEGEDPIEHKLELWLDDLTIKVWYENYP